MSKIQVDSIVNKDDTGGVDFPKGVTVTGVITATSLSGDVTIGAGSTSAPSLAPSGDSNTGIFFPSADTIAFAEGGAEAARIDSSGRLGIGIKSPRSKLSISGASGTDGINLYDNGGNYRSGIGGASTYLRFYAPSTGGSIQFGTLSTTDGSTFNEATRIDSSGRLLVGTSTARAADFVTASIQNEGTSQNTSSIQLTCNSAASVGTAAELNFSRSRGSAVGSNTAVSSGDNLGIINFTGADGTDLNSVAAQIRGVVDNNTGSNDMPGRLGLYTTNDTQSSPTERMRITSKGFLKASPRVTDGTHGAQRMSSPVHEFTCDDNDWVMQMTHTSSSGAEVSGLYIKYSQVSPNNTSQDFLYCDDSTTTRFKVRSNGGVANYQSNDVNLCDEREKKNIVNLDSTWDCLKQWELKKFHYNEDLDEDNLRYGVIAQQVASHCPEVITDWVKQKAEDAVLDEDGNVVTPAVEEVTRLAVKEQQMYWMAIKALQEAQTRIETLEAQNAAILARLDALEAG